MANRVQNAGHNAAQNVDAKATSTTDATVFAKAKEPKRPGMPKPRSDTSARDAKRQAAEQEKAERRLAAEIEQKESDDRFTSRKLLRAIILSFGRINFDPCWHEASEVRPDKYLDVRQGHNGLRNRWYGPLAFVNPPWSKQDKWLKRAHNEWRVGNVKTVVCLVPAATGAAFFHNTLANDANIFLIDGRPCFSKIDGSSQSTMHNTMVVVFGATDQQRARFAELIKGAWWLPEQLPLMYVEEDRVGLPREFAYFSTSCCSATYPASGAVAKIFCGPVVMQV